MLEGEWEGLPIYCSRAGQLRVEGRAIPKRMILRPEEAGLGVVEIHWRELRPAADARDWVLHDLPDPQDGWVRTVLEMPDPDRGNGFRPTSGTARFAAAVQVPRRGAARELLATDGWASRPDWADPDHAPGFRVTRGESPTLQGWAGALLRLPVIAEASAAQAEQWIALSPDDLVRVAYAGWRAKPLPGPRDEPLDSPAWSWLLDEVTSGVMRRASGDTPWATLRGQGVAWNRTAARDVPTVRTGDIVLTGDGPAILRTDDGDGWLDNGDIAIRIRDGAITVAPLEGLGGSRASVVRPVEFRTLRRQLEAAGYGSLGNQPEFGTDLERAVREFQRDRGMEPDGIPDQATRQALADFLARLESTGEPGDLPATP